MPFMCDALLPQQERYASLKYRHARLIRDPYRYTRAELVEIRALQLTPGMTRECIDILMRWPRDVQNYMLDPLTALDAEAAPLAEQNYLQATFEDGHAMFKAILEHRPNFSRYLPLYCVRYLQGRRTTAAQLAKEFDTTVARVDRWRRQDIHDPLTGVLRDRNLVRRGRPTHRRNHHVLGV